VCDAVRVFSSSLNHQFQFTAADVFSTSCTPGECAEVFSSGPVAVPLGTYTVVQIIYNG
jgi:hypothetical protein